MGYFLAVSLHTSDNGTIINSLVVGMAAPYRSFMCQIDEGGVKEGEER